MLRTHARVTTAPGHPSHPAASVALEPLPHDIAVLDMRGGQVTIDRATGAQKVPDVVSTLVNASK